MSRKRYFVRAVGTLTILLTLSTVTAFADEQPTAPLGITAANTAVIQVTYPESPTPLEDKQQTIPIDITAPDKEQAPVIATVYANPALKEDASQVTIGQQNNSLTEAEVPIEPKAVQRATLSATKASEALLPPVTASESYVDPSTLSPPAPLELASAVTDYNQTNTTSKDTPTSTEQTNSTTNQPAPSTSQDSTPTATKATTDDSGQNSAGAINNVPVAKKELPEINYSPAKAPQLITTNVVKYTTKAGDTLYLLAQKFITTVKSIKFVNNLKSDYLKVGHFLKVPSNAPINTNYKTKLVVYKVKSGDTLTLVAKKYGTTATSIKTTNALKSNALFVGQVLQVPYVSSVAKSNLLNIKYKINNGDSLKLIAMNFKTTVAAIKTLNGLKTDALFAGRYLQIPISIAAANQILVEVPTQNYTVLRGDSLSMLAQKCNTTIAVLKLLNNLTSDALIAGHIIKVPAGSSLAVTESIALDRANLSSRYQASRSEVLLLARLIYGESRGESYEGQVAVGAVVLNRTKSPDFPKTIGEVIYQQNEFSAVLDGQINLTPDASAFKAASAALAGEDPSEGALFYWNPVKAPNNKFLNAKPIIKRIGDHVFAK